MHVDRRSPRPQTPRNDLRDSGSLSSRCYQPRPNSARIAERISSARRNTLNGKTRSISARAKPEEYVEPVLDISDQESQVQQHKAGCPWLKARSRSKYAFGVSESNSGIMHPKPWGARNPLDIPCFCNVTHKSSKESQVNRPSKAQSDKAQPSKNSKAKIGEIVDNFGIFLERRKIRIAENEVAFLMKKIEEKIQKFVNKSKLEQKDNIKKNKNLQNHSPMQRPHQTAAKNSMSREQIIELQKAKMSGQGQANVLGKLETKKYLLELPADDPTQPNFRNILGMNPTIIHPHPEKMLIAVDDKQPYLAIPEDYRHYAMKTIDMDNYTGVVHHQAENTTLLLATTNPALTRRAMHSTPPQSLIQKPYHVGAFKQSRRS